MRRRRNWLGDYWRIWPSGLGGSVRN